MGDLPLETAIFSSIPTALCRRRNVDREGVTDGLSARLTDPVAARQFAVMGLLVLGE
jgi:hypothetical protein